MMRRCRWWIARLAEGGIQPRLPAITLHYLIEESGKLVEVDEVRVRTIALARLERILGSRFAGVKRTMLQAAQLDDLLRIGAMRNAIETLYRIRQSPEGETFQKGPPEAALGWGADKDVLIQSQDPWEEADHDSGWLEFPDLDLSESSEVIENELAIENVPEHAAHANDPPDSFIDDELPALVDVGGFGPGATAAGKAAESAIVSLFSGSYDTRGDQQSYLDTAARFLTDGSPHETYLMLEAIHEVTATAPRPLNATTRALRTLLFRAPPGTAQYLGVLLDRSGYFRANGFHPYMAEYLCLLNHPFDERKDIATIGGLSLGISSVGRLARFGSMRGDLLYEYGRIGALNFSFPFWRFDAQPIRLSGDNTTLFEQAGMGRRQHPATEYWTNPVTAKEEHLWGPIFAVAPGDEFHRSFKNDEAKRLGYAPLALNTSVVFRRAGIFTGTDYGVMLWRNSSLQFGRDRFQHPAMVCTEPMSAKEICELTPKDIDKRFHSVTGEAYFSGVTQRKIKFRSDGKQPPRAGDAVAVAAMELKHFSDQFQTVRAKYSRMKFDTHLETAWSSDGKRLLGGYRSPLFPAVVSQLEDRFNRRPSGGQPAIEHLAVSNPDYPPYAPHAVLPINERSLECLRLLADGKDSKVSSRSLRETGLEEFLNVAFTRGRNSELVMMPARE